MGDLLLFIVLALIGWALQRRKPKKKDEEARSSAPGRAAPPPTASRPVAGGQNELDLKEVFKSFFGQEDEDSGENAERERRKAAETAAKAKAEAERQRREAVRLEAEARAAKEAMARAAARRQEVIDISEAAKSGKPAAKARPANYKPPAGGGAAGREFAPVSHASEYAARLRANPDAAREALVYAEIFGTPVGERAREW